MAILINFALFQIGWFAVVLAAAARSPELGVAIIALVIAYHLYVSRRRSNELLLLAAAFVTGLVWDSLMVASGLFVYSSGVFASHLAPYWILAMWLLFATTLNLSLRWIKGRVLIAVLSGVIFGPLAYYAGHRLGAVAIPDMLPAMLLQAIGWGMILPALGSLAHWLDRSDTSLSKEAAS